MGFQIREQCRPTRAYQLTSGLACAPRCRWRAPRSPTWSQSRPARPAGGPEARARPEVRRSGTHDPGWSATGLARRVTDGCDMMTVHAASSVASDRRRAGQRDQTRTRTGDPGANSGIAANTARKMRQRIRATLARALARGHIDVNVAGEAVIGTLPAKLPLWRHWSSQKA